MSSDASVVVHHHHVEARPVSVSTEEGAQRWLDLPHRRLVYQRLGVPIVELPNGKFCVLVDEVEKALRAGGVQTPPKERPARATSSARLSDEELAAELARSGLRLVGGRKR